MILVTGAAGKTGLAIIRQLVSGSIAVRAWVRREAQAALMADLGVTEVVTGDLEDASAFRQAVQDIEAIYHICPNMQPQELLIGQLAIAAAQAAGVGRFVYHSVLHPQTQKMPHHWHKLRVEEALFESGLDVTILQPAAYMQNIVGSWPSITTEGVYRVPYPVTTKLSLVDLADVATAAVTILTQPGHERATYELVGPQNLSPIEIAAILSGEIGRSVHAEQLPIHEWRVQAETAGLSQYAIATLTKMFDYYAQYHFEGNSNVLRWLLGHEPTDLATCVKSINSQL